MKKTNTILAALLCAVMLTGCGQIQGDYSLADKHGRYNIEALYMHEVGEYSVATLRNGELKLETLRRYGLRMDDHYVTEGVDVQIIPDVPEGESMYVEYDRELTNRSLACPTSISHNKIHIHSVKDINGGGWNHGKFGHGDTRVIEAQ